MKTNIMLAGAALLIAACGTTEKDYDATGTFEATETTVSAEQSGVLLKLNLNEGDEIEAGSEVGLIDTTQIWLKIVQNGATKAAYNWQKPDVEKQIAVTRQQLEKAQTEQRRYQELVKDGAAPSKTLDDVANQVKVLQRQLEALQSTLSTQSQSLDKQMEASDAVVSQLRDQLRKCHVKAPLKGTVLEKYSEPGEFVNIGKPLFKIADTRQMFIRAYVTSSQLQHVKTGQRVKVFADYGDDKRKEYNGIVTWISNHSEFTPKTILTDDERADLVYAVKILIENDGYVKIGMYGEVKF